MNNYQSEFDRILSSVKYYDTDMLDIIDTLYNSEWCTQNEKGE